jgi:hypothetical protein
MQSGTRGAGAKKGQRSEKEGTELDRERIERERTI